MWGKSLHSLKRFSCKNAMEFYETKGYTPCQNSKGYKYFVEGYLKEIFVNNLEVKAVCYRSQKKNKTPHQLCLRFIKECEELRPFEAHCTCEAGESQSCSHLVGLTYLLQDLILRGLDEIPEETSCTSQPQQWNKPRGQKIEPEPLSEVVFYKPTKIIRSKLPVQDKFVASTTSEKLLKVSPNSIEDLRSKLSNINGEIPMACFLSASVDSHLIHTKKGILVPKNSVLGHQTTEIVECLDLPIIIPTLEGVTAEKTTKIFNNKPKVSSCRFDDFELASAIALEKQTRKQRDTQVWHEARRNRLTASLFGVICKRTKFNKNFEDVLKKGTDISSLKHVAIGIELEDKIRQAYLAACPEIQYFQCGLVVNPQAPFLGATPDGIILDEDSGYGVLEIKCKSGEKYSSLEEACKVKGFCLKKDENSECHLKHDDGYYFQIQGQMLVSGLGWGDLVIYFLKSDELFIERIYFDEHFCKEMYEKLFYIYNMYFTQ